jgi:hypothetical protein
VRKFLIGSAGFALLATFLTGVGVLSAPAAFANITQPANGANISGNQTFSASGTGSSTSCALVGDTSSTTIELLQGSTVLASASGSTGYGSGAGASASFTYETERSPNGSYTVNDSESYYSFYTNFFSFGCRHNTNTYTETVHIDNQSKVSFNTSSATSGDVGQTVTVSATLAESGGNGVTPPAGQSVCFSISGQGGSSCAATNSSGVATTNLVVSGPTRGATISASYAGGYYAASSTQTGFTVNADPTTVTTLITPTNPVYGQAITFHASVAGLYSYPTAPGGTVQFQLNGSDYGSPVSVSAGSASLAYTGTLLNAESYTVGAVYSGDGNYASSSGSSGFAVSRAQTVTSLTSALNPSTYGQSVTITATVTTQSPGSGAPTGVVGFDENGQPIGGAVTLVATGPDSAKASVVLPALDAGQYDITATYEGAQDFAISSGELQPYPPGQQINPASTTVSVSSSSMGTSVYGQSNVTFTATVSPVPPGAGTPAGLVDFVVSGGSLPASGLDLGSVSLNSSGSATSAALPTDLAPGSYTVSATYAGNTDFKTSQGSATQTINRDATTTTVTSSANPSVYGQAVTLTATVTANPPGSGTPTGTVQFYIDGVAQASPVSLSGGAASIALPVLDPGNYSITAVYSSSTDFLASDNTTNPLGQVVNPDPTTTIISSSANPSVFGQPVTFTATVTANPPGSGTPSGTVTFFDGTTNLGSETLTSGGGGDQASVTATNLPVGTQAITASYSGDKDFLGSGGAGSVSVPLTQTVNPAQTTTTLAQNGSIEPGQSVTFTATVAPVPPGAGTPTGTVTFYLDGAPIDTEPLVGGQATSQPVSGLSPGDYTLSATYSGSIDFLTSTGSTGQPVTQAATVTTLGASPNPATYTQSVSLVATVTVQPPGSGTPTGTVDFYSGQNLLGSSLLSNGQATLTTKSLPVGTDTLTASYVGDAEFEASQSATVSEQVGTIPTTATLASSPNPSSYGQPVTLSASVAPQSPYGGTPTGSVTFYDGSSSLGGATLSGGTAQLTVSSLGVGSHSISVKYAGDGTFSPSTSATVIQTVGKAATTVVAQPTNLTWQLSATLSTAWGPVAGAKLVFSAGSTVICSAALTNANGTATCNGSSDSLEIVVAGGYSVSFAGSADYLPSSANAGIS